jgi:cytochrome P450
LTIGIAPAGPPGHFLRGNLPDLMENPTDFLLHCAREYGDFVPLRFGPRRAVLVSDPDLISEVLVARSATFVKPYVLRTDRVRFGDDRSGDEADFWRRQTVAQPAFHQRRMPAYGAAMVAATRRMLDRWQDGETRDVLDDMMDLTLEIAVETLFGTELVGEADGIAEALRVIMDGFVPRLGALFLAPEWLPTPSNRRLRRASRRLDETMDAVIARARPGVGERDDLLSLLLRSVANQGGLTDRQVRQQATTFLLAGHETTALSLAWAWYLLARHPHAEAKLISELDSALARRLPIPSDLPRLSYAEGVVRESMRLYPPLWAMGRIAREETDLGGHSIAEGTIVIISQWVMHRDPRAFRDPERFDPARWTDGLANRLPRYAYFPFGGGPRGCIGSRFALMESVLLLATIAQEYSLPLVSDIPVQPSPSITLRPEHCVQAAIQRRTAPTNVPGGSSCPEKGHPSRQPPAVATAARQ